jgi:hypothetical protein
MPSREEGADLAPGAFQAKPVYQKNKKQNPASVNTASEIKQCR